MGRSPSLSSQVSAVTDQTPLLHLCSVVEAKSSITYIGKGLLITALKTPFYLPCSGSNSLTWSESSMGNVIKIKGEIIKVKTFYRRTRYFKLEKTPGVLQFSLPLKAGLTLSDQVSGALSTGVSRISRDRRLHNLSGPALPPLGFAVILVGLCHLQTPSAFPG